MPLSSAPSISTPAVLSLPPIVSRPVVFRWPSSVVVKLKSPALSFPSPTLMVVLDGRNVIAPEPVTMFPATTTSAAVTVSALSPTLTVVPASCISKSPLSSPAVSAVNETVPFPPWAIVLLPRIRISSAALNVMFPAVPLWRTVMFACAFSPTWISFDPVRSRDPLPPCVMVLLPCSVMSLPASMERSPFPLRVSAPESVTVTSLVVAFRLMPLLDEMALLTEISVVVRSMVLAVTAALTVVVPPPAVCVSAPVRLSVPPNVASPAFVIVTFTSPVASAWFETFP